MGDLDVDPDIVIECTGVRSLILSSVEAVASGGVVCLTGIGSADPTPVEPPDTPLGNEIVLQNKVIVGSVNANRRHYYKGAEALARADHGWLAKLITRRLDPAHFADALERQPDDIKAVIEFASL